MKKLALVSLFTLTCYFVVSAQYFRTTFNFNAATNQLSFYIKPTGGNLNVAIGSFQFDITYPIGANVNFGAITTNTSAFPGLNIVDDNLFTLNGEWVKRWVYQGSSLPTQMYSNSTEYLVFSVQLSGSGATTLSYKSNYFEFDPVFTVNDDIGNPLWDDIAPHDIYYPTQLQSGNFVYMLLNIALPLQLLSFEAKSTEDDVRLTWETQYEDDIAGFNIQRSTDGITFHDLHFVQSDGDAGINPYAFIDVNLDQSNGYYYRLATLEHNGTVSYSHVLYVKIVKNSASFILLDNPSKSIARVRLHTFHSETAQINIYSNLGILIAHEVVEIHKGDNDVVIDLADQVDGVYTANVKLANELISKKLFLQH